MEEEEKFDVTYYPENRDTNYVYYCLGDRLTDNILDITNDTYLLNVRKVFTNSLYFGVNYTTISNGYFFHHFKCKDRGYSETLVDNKDLFLEKYKRDLAPKYSGQEFKYFLKELQTFNLPYKVYFCFENQVYTFTIVEFDNGTVLRGLYGVNNKQDLDNAIKDFDIVFYKTIPTKEQVKYFVDDKLSSSSSNTIHTVSTEYSKIIVEHSTQYEKEWSDIKRRKV